MIFFRHGYCFDKMTKTTIKHMDNFGSFRIVSTLVCNIMTITRASFISTLLEIKTLGTDVVMKNFL